MWEIFTTLPLWYQYSLIFIFGSIIGSFLDVFTLRFHTGRSITGRSHCLSCGHNLSWYELLPVISYLAQLGRCRSCRSYVPARLLLMELLTGSIFLLVFIYSTGFIMLAANLLLAVVLLIITVYDQRHMIIPDSLTIFVFVLTLFIVGYQLPNLSAIVTLWPQLLSAASAFGFFAGLWLISNGRWIGFGDAKLAAPLGLLLGPLPTFSFIVFSFWIGAVVSLALLAIQKIMERGQKRLPFSSIPLRMKSEVPFAPFMIAAFLLVYLTSADVLRLMSYWFYESVFPF